MWWVSVQDINSTHCRFVQEAEPTGTLQTVHTQTPPVNTLNSQSCASPEPARLWPKQNKGFFFSPSGPAGCFLHTRKAPAHRRQPENKTQAAANAGPPYNTLTEPGSSWNLGHVNTHPELSSHHRDTVFWSKSASPPVHVVLWFM